LTYFQKLSVQFKCIVRSRLDWRETLKYPFWKNKTYIHKIRQEPTNIIMNDLLYRNGFA